jgi:hypothetical protein
MRLRNIFDDIISESKLSDYDGYNTPAALKKEKELKKTGPYDSIDDLDLNTLNRNKTIKEYGYGPLNPYNKEDSEKFWKEKAELWNTDVDMAKSARCHNCALFNQKKKIIDRIAKGIGDEGHRVVKEANLGFCELFWFKCAGDRTCDAWIGGGPIK